MRNTALGRCLVEIGATTRNNLIRSFLFVALVTVATAFGVAPVEEHGEDGGSYHTAGELKSVTKSESFLSKTINDPIALFTLVLSISTIFLWLATWRASRNQTKDMSRSLSIMSLQTDTLIKQKEISRLQYFAEHRPKLVIRSIALARFETGAQAIVNMTIANSGSSEAIIREANITFDIQREGVLPPIPTYDQDRIWLLNMRFPPGRNNPVVKMTSYWLAEWQHNAVIQGRGGALFLYGFINYEDLMEQRRGMGFCYRYDHPSRRFRQVNDPNYEYSD